MRERQHRAIGWLWIAVVILVFGAAMDGAASLDSRASTSTSHQAAASQPPKVLNAHGELPLRFEENRGQTDPRVKFLSRGHGYTLFLTPGEAVLALRKPAKESRRSSALGRFSLSSVAKSANRRDIGLAKDEAQVLRVKLIGGNPRAQLEGVDRLPAGSNYFIGNNPKKWRTNIPTYARVRYRDVYPGIDMVYYGSKESNLEYDFILAPGANPNAIKMRFDGAKSVVLNNDGDVVATLINHSEVIQHLPAIYQMRNGKRELVAGRAVLRGPGNIGFEVEHYDRNRAIYIDPGLVYSTFLGGNRDDVGLGIAVDFEGNAYVTGSAFSADFPTTSGAFQTAPANPNFTAYVAKLNPSASGEASLVYSTYLGGDRDDQGTAIAVDSSGDAYVTGRTQSTNFPTTPGAFQSANNAAGTIVGNNNFVTVLDPTGSSLLYSTYLGGYESGLFFFALGLQSGIAVDASGAAYVTGSTLAISNSSCLADGVPFDCCTGHRTGACIPFPTTPGAFQTVNNTPGGINVFMAKLDPSASGAASLVYSTLLGGIGGSGASGIAVDSAGNAYLTGIAGANFPITSGAFQAVSNGFNGIVNSFVAKLNPSATGAASLVYSTYLGGGGISTGIGDTSTGIAVDSAGDAYVTGTAASVSNPSCGAPGALKGGLFEACCTGPGTGTCIPFPTTPGAFQTVNNMSGNAASAGFRNAFVTKLNAAGSALDYSTYLGGSGGEYSSGIAIDSAGDAYVTGITVSIPNAQCTHINPPACCTGVGTGTCIPFPTTPGALQTVNNAANNGYVNAFVAKLDPSALGSASLVYSTYLGGNGGPFGEGDLSHSIAVSSAGNAYVTGGGHSSDFPTTSEAFQTVNNAIVPGNQGTNGFVTELDMIPGPTPITTTSPTATIDPTTTDTPTPTATPTATPTPIGRLRIAPAEIHFGKVKVGETRATRFAIVTNPRKNSGSATIAIIELRSQTMGNTTGFVIDDAKTTCKAGTPLARGKSCRVAITFTPPGIGAYSDQLMLTANVTNSAQPIGLTGVGK